MNTQADAEIGKAGADQRFAQSKETAGRETPRPIANISGRARRKHTLRKEDPPQMGGAGHGPAARQSSTSPPDCGSSAALARTIRQATSGLQSAGVTARSLFEGALFGVREYGFAPFP